MTVLVLVSITDTASKLSDEAQHCLECFECFRLLLGKVVSGARVHPFSPSASRKRSKTRCAC